VGAGHYPPLTDPLDAALYDGESLQSESSYDEYVEVEAILSKREHHSTRQQSVLNQSGIEYLVKYKDSTLPDEWRTKEELGYCFKMIDEFERRLLEEKKTKKRDRKHNSKIEVRKKSCQKTNKITKSDEFS
jgi:Chromo (CHRromatin Organisation MOdifier) domain